MMTSESGSAEHWDAAYQRNDSERSWSQVRPLMSLAMFEAAAVTAHASVVDVGGGASSLVDELLAQGHTDLTVLDVSAAGLDVARRRLGPAAAGKVRWEVTDLLAWRPDRTFGVWHDRAVFHFLTTERAKAGYLQVLDAATVAGSVAVFGTFAPDGPQQCSGLPVARYGPAGLAAELGPEWTMIAQQRQNHHTPAGVLQPFSWVAFRRNPPPTR